MIHLCSLIRVVKKLNFLCNVLEQDNPLRVSETVPFVLDSNFKKNSYFLKNGMTEYFLNGTHYPNV